MKTEQPAAAGDTEAARPITFSQNVIIQVDGFEKSRFIRAGEPSPFHDISQVPESLKQFIVNGEPEPEAPNTAFFEPNVAYQITSDGRMGRALRRQAGQLAAASAEREWAEREVEVANKLPRETLEAIQDAHDRYIGRELAIAEHNARLVDAAYEAAQRKAAGEKAAATYHVKRGAVYRKAEEARLRPGETVYQRQPSGDWWAAGVVDSTGGLPPEEVTL